MPANTQHTWPMPRDHMRRVLAKAQESIKWPWFVVMGYALYNATEESYKVIIKQLDPPTKPVDDIHYGLWLPLLTAILVFLPTFVRFFFGCTRYIDEQYADLRHRIKDQNEDVTELLSRSRVRRGLDAIFLLLHGMIIALLSLAISRPDAFFHFYVLLLIVNCVFLSRTMELNKIPAPPTNAAPAAGRDQDVHYRVPWRDSTVKFWLWNNFIFVCAFTALYWVWDLLDHRSYKCRDVFLYLFVLLFLLNSVLDLWKQFDFYLPKLVLIDPEPAAPEAPALAAAPPATNGSPTVITVDAAGDPQMP